MGEAVLVGILWVVVVVGVFVVVNLGLAVSRCSRFLLFEVCDVRGF